MSIESLLALAKKISRESDEDARAGDTAKFLSCLASLTLEQLTEVIARLASDNKEAAVSKSLREGAIVAAESRNARLVADAINVLAKQADDNAKSIVDATRKFDTSAFRLTLMLLVLSIVGLLVAFIPDSRKEPILEWLLQLLRLFAQIL